MEKNRKIKTLIWVLSFIIASIIKSIVTAIIGFRDNGFTNGFNILHLTESVIIFMVCFIPVYFFVLMIGNRWLRRR